MGLLGTQWTPSGTSSLIGWIFPIAGAELGNGWFIRPWLSYTTYRYEGAPGTVHGGVPGISMGLGYTRTYTIRSWTLSLAPGVQDTQLSPTDPSNANQGYQTFLLLQGECSQNFGMNWSTQLTANYAIGTRDYWSQIHLSYNADSSRFILGPSWVYQGGPNYSGYQVGAFLDWRASPRLTLGFSTGYLKFADVSAQGYAGLSATYFF